MVNKVHSNVSLWVCKSLKRKEQQNGEGFRSKTDLAALGGCEGCITQPNPELSDEGPLNVTAVVLN